MIKWCLKYEFSCSSPFSSEVGTKVPSFNVSSVCVS